MTERELRAVAEALARTGSKEWYDDGDGDSQGFRELAAAAIQSSDSKYVKGLVEALKRIASHKHINHDASINAAVSYIAYIAKEVLQNLPEDLRK